MHQRELYSFFKDRRPGQGSTGSPTFYIVRRLRRYFIGTISYPKASKI